MTTLALNYSTRILEASWNAIKKTFQGIAMGIVIARQTQANHYTAEQISRLEHNGQDYHVILADLNRKTIAQIHKEFDNEKN